MATNNAGVYQKDNGYWEYRFVMMVDGKKINKKKSTDAFGNKLKTKKEAIKAREAAMLEARSGKIETPKVTRRMVKEVYEEYCEKGRKDRAYQTIRKQDSIWDNHIFAKFGNRYVDEITVAEVMDYLAELYYIHNFSYQYTESFLKMFYLIFGQAYSRNYLDVDIYNKLCVNKDTRIRMPKMKSEDDTDIVAFSKEQLDLLDKYFKGTHAETVVLLSHKKADSYIHIDVEFGEGEGKIPVDSIAKRAEAYKPKEKVTYKMIKEYIEAKYGFKVHTAYIAEVKRNLGLPMYDAPNAVEELKQPRKHPTPEKVEAIKDALRYFAVI